MSGMPSADPTEEAVLERGIERLRELLGPDFDVAPLRPTEPDAGLDGVFTVRALNTSAPDAQVVVEAKTLVTPAGAHDILLPQIRLLRQLYGQATVLVIAPWLSPRTREILHERGVSFLDLTGNVDLRLPTGILIRTEGAQRNPDPVPHRRGRGLAGAAAGIVTRLLVDFKPPYRQKDVAVVGDISPGYVSRIFQTLDDEALVRRSGSVIDWVDWKRLLVTRAESVDVLRANQVARMVTPKGPDALYRSLISRGTENTVYITGSYAAREMAPSAVGGALMIYVSPDIHAVDRVADELELYPAAGRSPANVLLLRPKNEGPLLRPREFGATLHAGYSQVVLDCLSGPDRMPAEGRALLEILARDTFWRSEEGALAQQAAARS